MCEQLNYIKNIIKLKKAFVNNVFCMPRYCSFAVIILLLYFYVFACISCSCFIIVIQFSILLVLCLIFLYNIKVVLKNSLKSWIFWQKLFFWIKVYGFLKCFTVFCKICCERNIKQAYENSHWGEATFVPLLWKEFYSSIAIESTHIPPFGFVIPYLFVFSVIHLKLIKYLEAE